MIGLELCFGLLAGLVKSGAVRLPRLVDALSTRPAKIIGISPPSLKDGERANLTLVDPTLLWTPRKAGLRSRSKNTPFLDREIEGRVMLTLADGVVVFDCPDRKQPGQRPRAVAGPETK
jgi:dihydroorotase